MKKLLVGISGFVSLLGLLGLSILSASGEALVNDAIERYRLGDPGMFTFIAGNVNALVWVNNDLKSNGHPELFCVPPSATLGVQEVINILSKHVKESPSDEQRPVGSVILQSLKQSFPCK
jgi:Rap1a immunity proteins